MLDCRLAYAPATIQRCIDLFRVIVPTLVFTHPRVDYMLDHEVTHLLVRNASFAFPAPNASELPLTAPAQVPHLYYADPLDGEDPYTGEPTPVSTYVDVTDQLERKRQLLACHASQRAWLRAHHGIDEYLDSMQRHAARRGAEHGVAFAEAYRQHRGHAYPRGDLLADLLS